MLQWVLVIGIIWSASIEARQTQRPVSVSYENIIRCFPELRDERIQAGVQMNILKEIIDKKFLSSQSSLLQRKINLIDSEGKKSTLILRNNFVRGQKVETILTVQKVDDKGIVSEQKLPELHRVNPKNEVINSFLVGAQVLSDEYTHYDTRFNEISSTMRRNFEEIEELALKDPRGRREITCERKPQVGIICSCFKK